MQRCVIAFTTTCHVF